MPGSVAARVMAWQRRMGGAPGPLGASGEASNGQPAQVELLVNGAWVDITDRTLVWDDNGRIGVTSGIRDGGSQAQAADCPLELKNADGRFSPRNPNGDYYDILTWRNAQIRVSVPDGNGGKQYLIWGETSEWAPNWDTSGNKVWTDVTVNGILQRLAQGPTPEHSILYRAVTDPPLTGLVAYWPCEDPTGSTELKSALVSGSSMTWTGTPSLASYTGFGASDPLPTLTVASLTGGIARYDISALTQYQMRFLLSVPKAGFSDLDVVARMRVAEVAAGASLLNYFDIHYNNPPGGLGSYGAPGTLTILLRDGDEATFGASNSTTMDVRGRRVRVSLENSIASTTITCTLRVLDIDTGMTDSASITIGSTSISRVISMALAPATLAQSAGLTGGSAGHLLLQNTITDITDIGRAIQPEGEAAGRRMQRLCGETAVAFEWIGDLDDTVLMGPQGRQNLLALLRECEAADGGFLYESTDRLGLGYRTRASLYGQDPALVLSYTGFNLADVPVPLSDDRYVQNQVVVTVNGVSQTYTETTGALGTDRVGVYGETSGVELNLASTDAATLRDQAAWRVRLGTVDSERYPKISVNLAHPSMTPELKRAILGLRMGDRMQITGMPSWLAPDTVDQLIVGVDRSLNRFVHEITFTCLPAAAYNQVGNLDSNNVRIDIDGSELMSGIGSSDTTMVVVPSAGQTMLWTTDPADMPVDLRLGGEVVRLTETDPWLTDTFTRSVSSGWGTSDTGQSWGNGGGTATDFAVGSGYGSHTLTTVDISRRNFTDFLRTQVDAYVSITTSATATGGSLYGGLLGRYIDGANFYMARVEFTTANGVNLEFRKRINDVETSLGTYTTSLTHVPGTFLRLRFVVSGTSLKAKVWTAGTTEFPGWQIEATDTQLGSAALFGFRSIASAANTNVNPQVRYDDLAVVNPQVLNVTRGINGVVKSHAAGTSVSLAYPTYIAL